MGTTRKFFLNSVLLSAVTIAVRFVSVSFNAHVAVKVGAECMGLFTLTSSVYSLCVIFAAAGVNLAVVRSVSETLAKCGKNGENAGGRLSKIVLSASVYSLFFGVLTGAFVFAFADPIAVYLLGDERCVMSLRAFAVSLPAISVSSALAGYFTGIGRVAKNALCTVADEGARIILVSSALILIAPRGIDYACLAVVAGGAAAEVISLVAAFVLYKTDGKRKCHGAAGGSGGSLGYYIRMTARLALPVAVGNVARHGFISAEHLAIPRALVSYGLSSKEALSLYGVLHGMVLPVVMFPSAVLYSFAGLLIPEISSCRALGNTDRIINIGEKVFRSSLLFSICVSGAFLSFSDGIGMGLYNSAEASRQLRLMALLVPVMYLDSAVDGMLKGLGEEVYCMKVNVADSIICLVLVWILVPAFGIDGYIALTVISEVINAALSIIKLLKRVHIVPDLVKWIVCPVASVSASAFAVKLAAKIIPATGTVPMIALYVVLYGVGCFATGAVKRRDCVWILSLIKRKKRRASLSA